MKIDTLERPQALAGGCWTALQHWWSRGGRGEGLRTAAVSQGAQIILSDLWQDYFFAVWLSLPYGSVRRLVGKHCRGGSAYCGLIPVTLHAGRGCCVVLYQRSPTGGCLRRLFLLLLGVFLSWKGGRGSKRGIYEWNSKITLQLRHTYWANWTKIDC